MPVRKIEAGFSNVTGRVPSRKLDRMVAAESTLERDFFLLLEHSKPVDWYEEQPLTIEYRSTGKNREYTPDVLVREIRDSGPFLILYEIKPRSELRKSWSALKPKFRAAIRECKKKGWKFKILTEVEIRTQRLKNLQFLDFFCTSVLHCEDAYRLALVGSLNRLGSTTPKELLTATFHDHMKRAEVLPVLWRMICDGSIETNLDKPLTMHSTIYYVGDQDE